MENKFVKFSKFIIILIIIAVLVILLLHLTPHLRQKKSSSQQIKILCPNCNVVLVIFDTLRVANVGAYGYSRKITPTIDNIAQNGFIFTNAISAAPWTLPSVMSIFTGVYPSQHKVLNHYTIDKDGIEEVANLKNISPNIKTIAEVLKENGYKTGGFTGSGALHHQFGFDAGFDEYYDGTTYGGFKGFKDSIPRALEWIRNHKEEKIFVFLHGYDIHGQYVLEGGQDRRFVDFDYQGKLAGSNKEQYELREQGLAQGHVFLAQEDVRFLTALFDERIQRADEQFAQFIDEYVRIGLKEKTVFILTSDHGDEFYEHGRIDHGATLYEEVIHVPLIISIPGNLQARKIEAQVGSINIVPTVLEIVGINPIQILNQQFVGVSLIPLILGENQKITVFPETDLRYSTSQRAVRTWDNWKLIRDYEKGSDELYNLNDDPKETNNIINDNKTRRYQLEQMLVKHLQILSKKKYQ